MALEPINITANGSDFTEQHHVIIPLSVLFFLIGALGISGNVLVIFSVITDIKMRSSTTNSLIANLATADLLIMVFGIPEIVMFMLNRGWMLSEVLCKGNRFILVTSLYTSVLTLVAICIERYIGIIHPIKAHVYCNRGRISLVIGAIWPTAGLFGSATLIFNAVKQESPSSQQFCMLHFPYDHKFYYLFFKYVEFGLFYLTPLMIQVVLYAIISKHLFMGTEKLHPRVRIRLDDGVAYETACGTIKARKGVVKMLIASVIVYFLSYSPQHVLLFCDTFSYSSFGDSWYYIATVMIIAYINSAANPFLYYIFSQNFRRRFNSILHCREKKNVQRKNNVHRNSYSAARTWRSVITNSEI